MLKFTGLSYFIRGLISIMTLFLGGHVFPSAFEKLVGTTASNTLGALSQAYDAIFENLAVTNMHLL